MTQITATRTSQPARRLIKVICRPETFNLAALSVSSLVFSLGKLTVYAADQSQFIVYILSALAISQSLVVVLLAISGKLVFRFASGKVLPVLVVIAILLVNILGTQQFELILRTWNLEPIPQSLFQRAISLMFTTFIYLGFGWVYAVLSNNFNQVKSAKQLLTSLTKQQLELSLTIRDARNFAIREVSLEIQSTRGTLENFTTASSRIEEIDIQISQLKATLDEVENRIGKFSKRFPDLVRSSKISSRSYFRLSDIIDASTKQNDALPGLISIFAFFGFSSWLSYFLSDSYAFFWGIILSISSFAIFWTYEKRAVSKAISLPVFIRVLIYEALVISYLFFWLLILGYFGGDDSGSYSAALAYAAIPFIFFNGGAVLGGIVTLSQEHLESLTTEAFTLRKDMANLEQLRSDEDNVWKSLFVGDIALSPTTASVILRDATLTKDPELVAKAIPKVNALWKSVLFKLPT